MTLVILPGRTRVGSVATSRPGSDEFTFQVPLADSPWGGCASPFHAGPSPKGAQKKSPRNSRSRGMSFLASGLPHHGAVENGSTVWRPTRNLTLLSCPPVRVMSKVMFIGLCNWCKSLCRWLKEFVIVSGLVVKFPFCMECVKTGGFFHGWLLGSCFARQGLASSPLLRRRIGVQRYDSHPHQSRETAESDCHRRGHPHDEGSEHEQPAHHPARLQLVGMHRQAQARARERQAECGITKHRRRGVDMKEDSAPSGHSRGCRERNRTGPHH